MGKPGWKAAMIVFDESAVPGAQRRELIAHLEQTGASAEVELPPASSLPSLLVEGSERGLDECLKAPSVKEVLKISDDIEMGAL